VRECVREQVERLDLEATEASLHMTPHQGLVGSKSNSNEFNAQSRKSKAAGAEGGEGGAAEAGAVCRVEPSEPSEPTHRSREATYSYRSGEPLHTEKRDADLEEWAGETRGIVAWSRKGQQTRQEEEFGEWEKRRAGSGKGGESLGEERRGEESEAQSWLKVSGLLRRHAGAAEDAAAAAACAQRLHKEASAIRLLS
jgi:hypothetical protein